MFYLVYISTPDPGFGEARIRDMLERSRDFNRSRGLTGCLLNYQGIFLQYLEGSQVEVLGLYDVIKEDDRHSQATLISHGYMPSKEFGTNCMVYENFLGADNRMEYLELLLSSFIEDPEAPIDPTPASKGFWAAAKKLLDSRNRADYVTSEE
ncbi:BLUF domain-containing protein [Pricia sp.]|uniref:BLUF domain-containing protein n=1 Tax=Pricia sp. TaxID=2268138 RepID=UPI003593BA2D